MGAALHFLLLFTLIGLMVGPIVGIIGLVKKRNRMALWGFMAIPIFAALALAIGAGAALLQSDSETEAIDSEAVTQEVPSPRNG